MWKDENSETWKQIVFFHLSCWRAETFFGLSRLKNLIHLILTYFAVFSSVPVEEQAEFKQLSDDIQELQQSLNQEFRQKTVSKQGTQGRCPGIQLGGMGWRGKWEECSGWRGTRIPVADSYWCMAKNITIL